MPREGRRITLSVDLSHSGQSRPPTSADTKSEVFISAICVSGKTKWDMLDIAIKRSFKDYVLRIDPNTSLGLNGESILCYNLGEVTRSKDQDLPELLPCGYLVGDSTNISLTLKGNIHYSHVSTFKYCRKNILDIIVH